MFGILGWIYDWMVRKFVGEDLFVFIPIHMSNLEKIEEITENES